MTIVIPNTILQYAVDNGKVYREFVDYFNHWRYINGDTTAVFSDKVKDKETGEITTISFAEKESKMNAAIIAEIMRVAGVQNVANFSMDVWSTNPQIKWASFAVVQALIDLVMPDTIIKNIGLYSDVRTIGWGDSATFNVKPRDLFVVSKVGRSKRTTQLNKQLTGQVPVIPELRAMTVFVSLMKVLAGQESLAELVIKMTNSFETELSYDVYSTMATAMAALDTTADTGLRVVGYTQNEFVRLSQTVSAWNGGAKAIAVGTQRALAKILPSNANYRYDIESDFVKVGYLRNFQGTDIMVLPQVADYTTPFGLKLSDSKIWILSPSSQKIVKVVLEGATLSHTTDPYANANLVQTTTMYKSWGAAVATNAVAAEIAL